MSVLAVCDARSRSCETARRVETTFFFVIYLRERRERHKKAGFYYMIPLRIAEKGWALASEHEVRLFEIPRGCEGCSVAIISKPLLRFGAGIGSALKEGHGNYSLQEDAAMLPAAAVSVSGGVTWYIRVEPISFLVREGWERGADV